MFTVIIYIQKHTQIKQINKTIVWSFVYFHFMTIIMTNEDFSISTKVHTNRHFYTHLTKLNVTMGAYPLWHKAQLMMARFPIFLLFWKNLTQRYKQKNTHKCKRRCYPWGNIFLIIICFTHTCLYTTRICTIHTYTFDDE